MFLLKAGASARYWLSFGDDDYMGPQFIQAASFYFVSTGEDVFITTEPAVRQRAYGHYNYLVTVRNAGTHNAWFKFTGGEF
jgi:hypothetical protein